MNISTPTEIISKDIEAYVKTINDIRINLIDETNSYAAHHLVKLFDDNGLHKDANDYRGLAKSCIDTKSAPDTSPNI